MSLTRLSFSYVRKGAYTPAGSMCSRVTFMNPPVQGDDGRDAAPTEFITAWAKVEALVGREVYKQQDIVQEVTHLITVNYIPGLLEAMTVNFEGRTFVIQAIDGIDERKVQQRVLCVERDQNG